jgi:hypothetical protein
MTYKRLNRPKWLNCPYSVQAGVQPGGASVQTAPSFSHPALLVFAEPYQKWTPGQVLIRAVIMIAQTHERPRHDAGAFCFPVQSVKRPGGRP